MPKGHTQVSSLIAQVIEDEAKSIGLDPAVMLERLGMKPKKLEKLKAGKRRLLLDDLATLSKAIGLRPSEVAEMAVFADLKSVMAVTMADCPTFERPATRPDLSVYTVGRTGLEPVTDGL